MNHIRHLKCLEKLVKVLKIILTLLHGQTSAERGFSVNKSLLVENLSTQSLVSKLCVYDYIKSKNLTLKISLFVAHCVKVSEVQESSMRITLKRTEKENRVTKNHLNARVSKLQEKRKHC